MLRKVIVKVGGEDLADLGLVDKGLFPAKIAILASGSRMNKYIDTATYNKKMSGLVARVLGTRGLRKEKRKS